MKTLLEELKEQEMLAAHNEGAGHEHEIQRLNAAIKSKDKTAVWCSAHHPTGEQIKSLESQGYLIYFLKDVNPDLFGELTSLQVESSRSQLANKLLEMDCDTIIQPAGDPAFQNALGRAYANESGKPNQMKNFLM
jgi:hypothetical protein